MRCLISPRKSFKEIGLGTPSPTCSVRSDSQGGPSRSICARIGMPGEGVWSDWWDWDLDLPPHRFQRLEDEDFHED